MLKYFEKISNKRKDEENDEKIINNNVYSNSGNFNGGNYPWFKVASAYLKYVKQTI